MLSLQYQLHLERLVEFSDLFCFRLLFTTQEKLVFGRLQVLVLFIRDESLFRFWYLIEYSSYMIQMYLVSINA